MLCNVLFPLLGVHNINGSPIDFEMPPSTLLHEDMVAESMASEGITSKAEKSDASSTLSATSHKTSDANGRFGNGVRHFHFDSTEQLSLEDLEKLDAKKKKTPNKIIPPPKKQQLGDRPRLPKPVGHFTQTVNNNTYVSLTYHTNNFD